MLKLVIGAVLLVCAAADVSHLVRQARFPPPQPLVGFVPLAPQPSGAPIPILRQSQDISPDGSYNYAYETGNGISAQEEGRPAQISPQEQAEQVAGSFAYTSPEGVPVSLSYVANENGFQPSGPNLPTPPPIPEAIQRSLEFNARNAPASAN